LCRIKNKTPSSKDQETDCELKHVEEGEKECLFGKKKVLRHIGYPRTGKRISIGPEKGG